MNGTAATVWGIDASPRLKARVTGAVYLVTILTGIFAQGLVSERLVVGDAATTAGNILAHKGLYQTGFAIYVIEMASQVAVTALFYSLLKPVSGTISLVAAFLGLTGCVIKAFGRLFFIAPLFILGGGRDLTVFHVEQLQSLALLALKLNDRAAEMALVFFGFYAFLTGYLVFRSTFLPRILGAISMCAGLGWLSFLYPPLAYRLFPVLLAVALLGSASLIVWLLVRGVDVPRWKERARAAL